MNTPDTIDVAKVMSKGGREALIGSTVLINATLLANSLIHDTTGVITQPPWYKFRARSAFRRDALRLIIEAKNLIDDVHRRKDQG